MKLKRMEAHELRCAYETDLKKAFPSSELKPFSAMERLMEKGVYDPLCLVDDDGSVLGYVLLWRHEVGDYVLVEYLCVPEGQRNRGIGAKLLAAIGEHYPPETVFLWESEAPTGDAQQDDMILRRLGFYRRCGAEVLGYDCALFGVHFKVLCLSAAPVDEETALKRHRELYLHHFGQERYAQFIQIPLLPGEAIKPVTDWTED